MSDGFVGGMKTSFCFFILNNFIEFYGNYSTIFTALSSLFSSVHFLHPRLSLFYSIMFFIQSFHLVFTYVTLFAAIIPALLSSFSFSFSLR